MGHSFTLNQLLEHGYQDICDSFFKLCNRENDKKILEEILYQGEYNGFVFSSDILNKDNPELEIKRRINMAYLFLTNPDTFKVLVNCKVNLFHGTTSNALPKIIKYGLNSYSESIKNGIKVETGEVWSRYYNGRDFVSFTDILDIAEGYAYCNENDKLFFEVIIGTTVDDVYEAGKCIVRSDVPEVGVRNKLPLKNIRIIFVPNDKVKFVKSMIDNYNIEVLPISDFRSIFYYRNKSEIIDFLNNCNINGNNNKKTFKLDEIKRVLNNRVINLKNRIGRFVGENDYNGKIFK